jgi:tetratricopeptide (TPR) repeat protein
MRIWSLLPSVSLLTCLSLLPACGAEAPPPAEPTPVEAPAPAKPLLVAPERVDTPPLPADMQAISEEWVNELKRLQGLANANSGSAGSWMDLGMAYEKCAMRELALECYAQAQLRKPGDPKSWYRAGICHWRLGNFPLALANLSRAQAIEPGYAPCYYRKGIIEMDMGDFDAAWKSFSRGIQVNSDYVGCWIGQARILLQQDKPQHAVAMLEPLAEKHPADTKINNLLFTALQQAGVATERVRVETPFLGDSPDPGWGDPWQMEIADNQVVSFKATIRSLLRDLGQAERALTLMKERKSENPDDWSFVQLQAQALYQLKRLDEASQLYINFLKVEPKDVAARLQLAFYKETAGTPKEGLRWIDEALRLDPNNIRGWTSRGRMLCMAQQYEAARPALEKALGLDPASTEIMYWMINTMMGLTLFKEALPFFRSYLALKPDDGDVWLDFARARIKIRAFIKAEAALDQAVALNVGREKMVERLRDLIERRKEAVRNKTGNKDQ